VQSLSVSAHTAGVPAPAALALCRRCQRSLRQACQGRSWERAQRRNAAAHALAPWAGDVSGPMEGSAHASGALVPRWRGVWRRGGNRTLHRGNGHFNSCSVPSYFFGLTGTPSQSRIFFGLDFGALSLEIAYPPPRHSSRRTVTTGSGSGKGERQGRSADSKAGGAG